MPETAADSEDPRIIQAFCQQHFPDVYTGMSWNEEERTYVIYRTSGKSLDRQLSACFPTARFTFRDTSRTQRQLEDAVQRIVADWDYWRSRGVEIHSVGPEPGGAVEIETTTPELAAELLPSRYPGIPLHIRKGGPIQAVPPAAPPKFRRSADQ